MQARRKDQQWVVRWPIAKPTGTNMAASSTSDCLFCDDDPDWIELRDFALMPKPAAIRECDRCGTATAVAAFAITSRSWGEAIADGTARRPATPSE